MRAALEVLDPVPLQLRLELRRAAPGRVLAPLIGEDLARHAVVGDPAGKRFQHQRAALVVRQRKTHQIARMIVEECRHVDPLVAAQQEREQIRLPELVRFSSLEALHGRPRSGLCLCTRDPCRLCSQHSAHRGV
jgi:hypothetical protein